MEMFSLPRSVAAIEDLQAIAADADLLHLHRVVGMLDHARIGPALGDKPLVWALADMNAFTGGCRHPEGWDGCKRECRDCPLLGAPPTAASRMPPGNAKGRHTPSSHWLHIVCPSRWMVERVRARQTIDLPVRSHAMGHVSATCNRRCSTPRRMPSSFRRTKTMRR